MRQLNRAVAVLAFALTIAQVGLASPAGAQAPRLGERAPDFSDGGWINSAPLTLDELRGRVVLVEFWTYG
jgi:hypothetical protein